MRLTKADVGDALLAVALVVFGVIGTAAMGAFEVAPDRPIDPVAFALVIAAGGMLAIRRRRPLVTLTVVAVLTSSYLVVGYPFGPILFSFFAAVYTAARHRPLDRVWPWMLGALLLLLPHVFTSDGDLSGLSGVLPASVWVVVPFAIGATLRVSHEASERERAELVRQRLDGERLRLAHEVHDVVGHGLAAIKMQADVALHVLERRPENARDALEAISRASGEALDELRITLGHLRDRSDDGERTSRPHMERLGDLKRRMTDAGVQVRLRVVGDPQRLPPAADLAGYRVVQEALTNVLRHGETKVADVRVDYRPDAVVITVANPVPATVALDPGGLGIAGMRRRVIALGGEFAAGPTPGHRFEVRATIPTNGRP